MILHRHMLTAFTREVGEGGGGIHQTEDTAAVSDDYTLQRNGENTREEQRALINVPLTEKDDTYRCRQTQVADSLRERQLEGRKRVAQTHVEDTTEMIKM